MPERRHARKPAVSRFHCSPAVAWAVEQTGLTLLHRETGRTRALPYPQAALWDLLSRARPWNRLGETMAAIMGVDRVVAEAWMKDTVLDLAQEGWLVES